MMSEKRQKEMFDRSGNSQLSWVFSALNLIASAEILLEKYNSVDINNLETGERVPVEARTLSSAMLLYGFGIECMFKALWIHRGNTLVDDGKYIGIKGVKDHKLHDLADASNFQLSQEERELLIRASVLITSTGRYPVAKNWNETRIKKHYRGGYGPPNFISNSDFKIFNNITNRIQKEIGIDTEPKIFAKETP